MNKFFPEFGNKSCGEPIELNLPDGGSAHVNTTMVITIYLTLLSKYSIGLLWINTLNNVTNIDFEI